MDWTYIATAAATAVIVWLLTTFLKKTVGTSYVTRADFVKFKSEHDESCKTCQSRAALVQIKALLVELAIKAGVPAHEVAKIANINTGEK